MRKNPAVRELVLNEPPLGAEAIAVLARNNELHELWVSVARIVQRGDARRLPDVVAALTPGGFQEKLFRFFWPWCCSVRSSAGKFVEEEPNLSGCERTWSS